MLQSGISFLELLKNLSWIQAISNSMIVFLIIGYFIKGIKEESKDKWSNYSLALSIIGGVTLFAFQKYSRIIKSIEEYNSVMSVFEVILVVATLLLIISFFISKEEKNTRD